MIILWILELSYNFYVIKFNFNLRLFTMKTFVYIHINIIQIDHYDKSMD